MVAEQTCLQGKVFFSPFLFGATGAAHSIKNTGICAAWLCSSGQAAFVPVIKGSAQSEELCAPDTWETWFRPNTPLFLPRPQCNHFCTWLSSNSSAPKKDTRMIIEKVSFLPSTPALSPKYHNRVFCFVLFLIFGQRNKNVIFLYVGLETKNLRFIEHLWYARYLFICCPV